MTYQLVCSRCGSAAEREPAYKCTRCGGILTFHYGFRPGDYRVEPEKPGIFRFSSILPVQNVRPAESLGEGGTPLLPSAAVGPANGLERVYFKLDSLNPSGSFKDRALAVAMVMTTDLPEISRSWSTRLRISWLVPDSTPANKTRQAMCHGTQVVKVPGNYSRSYALCREMAETYGWFDMTTTFINPYAREGYKTIGYEIFEQLGRRVPDAIVLPTGAGPILAAVWQAFVELEQLGLAERMPKLVCVQAKNCGPIAGAFLRNAGQVEPCADAQPTLASGINDSLMGYADDGDYTLACIRRSGGTALLLDEEEIRQSVRQLCREGVFAEPAGAVSAAAIARLARSGFLQKTDTVVGVVTGHGLKNPLELEAGIPTAASAAELARILEEG